MLPSSRFCAFVDEGAEPAHQAQVGGVVRSALHGGRILQPLLPQAARAQETRGLVASEIQVDERESAHGHGLVVCEIGAAKIAIKLGGERIGVARRAETGQGYAIGQPGAADLKAALLEGAPP